MSDENPFEHHSDAALIRESGMGHPGYGIEAMRRLRNAVESQSRTKEERKKLRGHLGALRGMVRIFEEATGFIIEGSPVVTLMGAISRIESDFPGLVPPFDQMGYFSHSIPETADDYYKSAGIRAYIETAIPILEEALVEASAESSPVTEHRAFEFIADPKLRGVLERDYEEIQRAFFAQCYKSAIILAGGAIETILLDLLNANPAKALASPKAPKGKADIGRWDLADLIAAAVDLGLVPEGVEKLSHSVREYRNLVHPGVEARTALKFGREEARIAIEVLHMIHRELS